MLEKMEKAISIAISRIREVKESIEKINDPHFTDVQAPLEIDAIIGGTKHYLKRIGVSEEEIENIGWEC